MIRIAASTTRAGALVAGSMALALTVAAHGARPDDAGRVRALVGGHVIGVGNAPEIADATILVRGGRIEAIGPADRVRVPDGAHVVRLAGTFVLPGLVSAHAHVSDVDGLRPRAYTEANTLRQLGVFARYGVTTVWSLGGEEAPAFRLRDAQATPALDRARIHVAGEIITARTIENIRRNGHELGLASMCIVGGQAVASIWRAL